MDTTAITKMATSEREIKKERKKKKKILNYSKRRRRKKKIQKMVKMMITLFITMTRITAKNDLFVVMLLRAAVVTNKAKKQKTKQTIPDQNAHTHTHAHSHTHTHTHQQDKDDCEKTGSVETKSGFKDGED